MIIPSEEEMRKHVVLAKRMGFKLIPLYTPMKRGGCTCGNPKCKAVGKHPMWSKWTSESTWIKSKVFMDDIIANKHSWSENIGILTGKASDIIVIDIDGDIGKESLKEFEKEYGKIPNTFSVSTGRGFHLYVKSFAQLKSVIGILPGIDIRANGAQVVFAGSVHASGSQYRVSNDFDITSLSTKQRVKLLELSGRVKPKTPLVNPISVNGECLEDIWVQGIRHNLSLAVGGVMARGEVDEEDAVQLILSICEKANDDEIEDRERCVRDAYAKFEECPVVTPTRGNLKSIAGESVLASVDSIVKQMTKKKPYNPEGTKVDIVESSYATELLKNKLITRTEKLVYECLESAYDEDERCASILRVDIEVSINKSIRTVQRGLNGLYEKGYVVTFGNWKGKGKGEFKREANSYYLKNKWIPTKDLDLIKKASTLKEKSGKYISEKVLCELDKVLPGVYDRVEQYGRYHFKNKIAKAIIPCIKKFMRLRSYMGEPAIRPGYVLWALRNMKKFLHTFRNAIGYASGLLSRCFKPDPCQVTSTSTRYEADEKDTFGFFLPEEMFGHTREWIDENYFSPNQYLREHVDRLYGEEQKYAKYLFEKVEAKTRMSRNYTFIKKGLDKWIVQGFKSGWNKFKSLTYFLTHGILEWNIFNDNMMVIYLRGNNDFKRVITIPLDDSELKGSGKILLHGDGTVETAK